MAKSAETVPSGGYTRFSQFWKEQLMLSIFLAILVQIASGASPAITLGPAGHETVQTAITLGPAG
jgi:hypothetical protein